MTQRHIITLAKGQPVKLTMGWDRPLQRYFALAVPVGKTHEDAIYDSMMDTTLEPFGDNDGGIDYFVNTLLDKGVYLPLEFIEAVDFDGMTNQGNLIQNHKDAFSAEQVQAITKIRKACEDSGLDPDAPVLHITDDDQTFVFQWFPKFLELHPEFLTAEAST